MNIEDKGSIEKQMLIANVDVGIDWRYIEKGIEPGSGPPGSQSEVRVHNIYQKIPFPLASPSHPTLSLIHVTEPPSLPLLPTFLTQRYPGDLHRV